MPLMNAELVKAVIAAQAAHDAIAPATIDRIARARAVTPLVTYVAGELARDLVTGEIGTVLHAESRAIRRHAAK